jgi:hypothetical protein
MISTGENSHNAAFASHNYSFTLPPQLLLLTYNKMSHTEFADVCDLASCGSIVIKWEGKYKFCCVHHVIVLYCTKILHS